MTPNMKTTLKSLALLIISTIMMTGCNPSNEKAKYIFLFIGDGMGHSQVATTESYLSYKAGKLGGERLSFTEFPHLAMAETYSANRAIACSASSGTSIACGIKTNNGHLGVDPSGNNGESMAEILKEEGYNIGIMSTVPVNHATPAAFYGHNSSRSDYYQINKDLYNSGFDFFAGAGLYDNRGKKKDLPPSDSLFEVNGYKVCYGMREYEKKSPDAEKVVFLQQSGRADEIDYYNSDGLEEGDISLAEMLKLCLDFIGDEEPFFIMCEGGEIDWAAHSNQTMTMVNEILGLDEAVRTALEFYHRHPEETLIIVTADHETGGVALGQGVEWKEEIIGWESLEKQWLESGKENTLSYEENQKLNNDALIGWTSNHHTGGPVPVYAIGKGAENFSGRINNTDIKGKILGE